MANGSGNVTNIVGLGGVDSTSNLTIPEANAQGYFSLNVGIPSLTSSGYFCPLYKGGLLYQVPPYIFTVTSASATVGATYTNNGNTYTVGATISTATTLTMSGASGLITSGTVLTKTSGTGDATITFSSVAAGKTCVVVHVIFTSTGAAGQGMQLVHSLTTFAQNVSSITSGFYQGGVSASYAYYTTAAFVPVPAATMYTFPSAAYPGVQVTSNPCSVILICKEI